MINQAPLAETFSLTEIRISAMPQGCGFHRLSHNISQALVAISRPVHGFARGETTSLVLTAMLSPCFFAMATCHVFTILFSLATQARHQPSYWYLKLPLLR